ncbi:MAG: ABC transporter ATP-binding protein [Thermoanaerobaculia bacterium]|nr:ABC transporter ATP-binding protein [Thermoanaerobaculia bacterium]
MKAPVASFLFRFFRRYLGWGLVGIAATVISAVGMVALLSLIEPIFSEVLLSDEPPPGAAGVAVSALQRGEEAAPEVGEPAREVEEPVPEETEEPPLEELKRKADLTYHLRGAYRSLKRRWGIDGSDVVWFAPALFVLVFLVRSLGLFVTGYAFQRIGLGATTDMRNHLYRQILDQSSRFYTSHPSGELVSRVVNDIGVMQTAVSTRLMDVIQQPLALILMIWYLLSIHPQLTLLSVVAAPLLLYPIVRFGKGMRRTSHRSQEHMADLASLVSEGVRGHRVVKAFNMEDFEYRRFWKASRRHLKVNLWAQVLSQASSPVVESLSVAGAAILLIFAGKEIRAGDLETSEFVTFLIGLFALYDPVRKLNKVNLVLQKTLAAAQRVAHITSIPIEVTEPEDPKEIEDVTEEIRFEGVQFSYETEPVLKEIDLAIRQGEVVALVGPSGAGKSSLVNLLPRYFDPDEGRVLIDGIDIRELSLASLRSLIAVVTQETILFNDSIRNNIAYGRADLGLDLVREAAEAAYAHEFIEELPEGYDTQIGEGGAKLSGGQRQRLAIARAILKDAPILILDEATSALDSESEALVQKALGNLVRDRTTLVIAHRLSTVVNSDRIVVMDAGRIVGEGTHQELVERDGVYKRLYDLQFEV